MAINIIKVKKMSAGLFTQKKIEATRITSDWYLWIHHTINQIPNNTDKKFRWQKKTFRKSNRD